MRGKYYICIWLPLFLLSGFVTINAIPVFFNDFGGGPEGGFAAMGAAITLRFTAPFMVLFVFLIIIAPKLGAMRQHPKIALGTLLTCIVLGIVLYTLNTREVTFRVIDQYGDPVPDVTIGYHRNKALAGIQIKGYLTTDSSGETSVHYFSRDRIGLSSSIRKDGYKISNVWRFDERLDTQPPAIIQAWKLDKPAPLLLHQNRRTAYREEYPGSYTFGFNFEKNTINKSNYEDVDVVVTIHNTGTDHNQNRTWNWGVSFEFQGDGGMQPSKDTYSFSAPAEGYQKEVKFEYPATMGREWSHSLKTESHVYYFKTKDGKYGTTNLGGYGYKEGNMSIQFKNISLNYEGGQNLTYVYKSNRNRSGNRLTIIP